MVRGETLWAARRSAFQVMLWASLGVLKAEIWQVWEYIRSKAHVSSTPECLVPPPAMALLLGMTETAIKVSSPPRGVGLTVSHALPSVLLCYASYGVSRKVPALARNGLYEPVDGWIETRCCKLCWRVSACLSSHEMREAR